MPSPQTYREPGKNTHTGADLPQAVQRNIERISARIRRLRAAQERVIAALRSDPPVGVKRNDWVARKLNHG
jgi:hypothetical protein